MMKNKLGKLFMLFGIVLIVAALSLFSWNEMQSWSAEQAAMEALTQIQQELLRAEPALNPEAAESQPLEQLGDDTKMTVKEIDGYGYIGYITLPTLKLELPIMSQWDEIRLKTAPCRFTGSVKTDNLTIAGHNYKTHFGKIRRLNIGDPVIFTDMDGTEHHYQVTAMEELAASDVERVISGLSDLILFTCTYGGQTRVTIFCDRTDPA